VLVDSLQKQEAQEERGRFLKGVSGNPEGRFKPGQSGNPAGRPPGSEFLAAVIVIANQIKSPKTRYAARSRRATRGEMDLDGSRCRCGFV
jgi:hypothetical protein